MVDQRIQYTEELVGANHPTKADTLNRLVLVDHNNDGTHKKPSFSVHRNGTNQTGIPSGTWTKVGWSFIVFDTHGDFDTTNYRFVPSVAGKYLLSAAFKFINPGDGTYMEIAIRKNGTEYNKVAVMPGNYITSGPSITVIVDANGSGDYFEVWAYQSSGVSLDISGGVSETFFMGCRID